MYNIYNRPLNYDPAEVTFSKLDYIINKHKNNLDRVTSYYKNASGSVKSNHLLVRILQSLPVSNELPLHQYKFMVSDNLNEISNSFDLTSTINTGSSLKESIFLGEDVEEIIILNNEPFMVEQLKARWKNTSSVRFLTHPKTDLAINLIDGEKHVEGEGYSVVTINLPLLACQYRLWKESVKNKEDIPTVMHFIHQYVLTNALKSYQEISMFNIIYKLFSGIEIVEDNDDHPFYLNQNFDKTISGLSKLIETRLKRKESFYEFLEGVSPIGLSNLREINTMPKIPQTRQVLWALVIARLKLIGMLITWDVRVGGSYNREELNKVERSLKQLRSDKNISSIVSNDLKKYVEEFIEKEIKEPLD